MRTMLTADGGGLAGELGSSGSHRGGLPRQLRWAQAERFIAHIAGVGSTCTYYLVPILHHIYITPSHTPPR